MDEWETRKTGKGGDTVKRPTVTLNMNSQGHSGEKLRADKNKPLGFGNKKIVKVGRFGFKWEIEIGNDKSLKNFGHEG